MTITPTPYKQKSITFTLDGNDFDCRVQNWRLNNNTPTGEKMYSQCSGGTGGEFVEEPTPDWTLEITFYSDWTLDGISDFLTSNDQEVVAFVLRHHEDIPGSGVQWTGTCTLHAPTVGADAMTTEMTEVVLPVTGKPTYARL